MDVEVFFLDVDENFKVEEVDDQSLSQACDKMKASKGFSNISLTQMLADSEHDEFKIDADILDSTNAVVTETDLNRLLNVKKMLILHKILNGQ